MHQDDISPSEEARRLASLHALGLMDTKPEEVYDRLTRLATQLFDVPICILALVDSDRMWIKSQQGITFESMPRAGSFCDTTILSDDVLVVENASEDARFNQIDMVAGESSIRFYAGCSIHAPDGVRVGTFCILDTNPRGFSEQQSGSLSDLAAIVDEHFQSLTTATTCELTGILNRRGFMMMASQSLALFARENIPSALAFIDLDYFKTINDTYGHKEGDRVLQLFARQLTACFRRSDIVARMCGDEFVVMLVNIDKKRAKPMFERFSESLAQEGNALSLPVKVEFSYGVTDYNPERHTSLDAWIAECDMQMYRVKFLRKNVIA